MRELREMRERLRVFSSAAGRQRGQMNSRTAGRMQGPARRLLPVFLLCLMLALSACGGDEETSASGAAAGAAAGSADVAVDVAAGGADTAESSDGEAGRKVRVWVLSEPGPAPSPEELAKAQRMVDYANLADRTMAGLCGRYTDFFKLGLAEYASSFSTLGFGVDKPRAGCLTRALSPSDDLFPDGERARAVKDLETMDALREEMSREYEALRAYVKDGELVDDGKRGRQLVQRIETLLAQYADSLEDYLALVDRAAAEAQDVMLTAHPLRDHVRLATDMVSVIRKVAERIALHDPDPGWLDVPMANLDEEIERAWRLPFPVAGEVEMHYRQFLKAARGLADLMRQGQLESFHPEVRKAMNERWSVCLAEYNAFVDALAAPVAPVTPAPPNPQGS